jgi:hypothetical protein
LESKTLTSDLEPATYCAIVMGKSFTVSNLKLLHHAMEKVLPALWIDSIK